jgi:signal transduction histidine kinase
LRHTVEAQEEERARIARELHDETAQTLTAASLNFCTLGKMLEGNNEVADVVDRLQGLCRQMNQDLYRLVHDLRPAQLDDLGLVPALRHLTGEGQRGTGVRVAFNTVGSVKRLDPFVETIIFRIVQEALTNVIRHAETDHALVELDFSSEQIVTLRVSDKGKGFEDDTIQLTRPGWGLIGVAERVESIDGILTIDSAPGKGTSIEVVIECGGDS